MATLKELTEESTSRYVQAGPVRIHYNEVGTGDPILCIHGGGPGATSWSNFKGNIQDLARNHRLVMMDMPGFGKSDNPVVEKEWLTFTAKVIKDMLEALEIDSLDIIGNSMGGQAAVKLAIDYPEKVKHLVVIGSQPAQAATIQALPLEALRNIAEYYQGEGPTMDKMRTLIKSLVYDASFLTDEVLRERYEASTTPAQMERAKRPRPAPQDLYLELGQNKASTLIIWGQDDKGGALEVGLLMLRKFPNARMHIFQRCGHWAHVERREEFDRIVLDFFHN